MKILNCCLVLAAVSFVMIPGLAATSEPLKVNEGPFPGLRFWTILNAAAKNYLGLGGSGTFTIPKIKADTVIIEIFSMYCRYAKPTPRL